VRGEGVSTAPIVSPFDQNRVPLSREESPAPCPGGGRGLRRTHRRRLGSRHHHRRRRCCRLRRPGGEHGHDWLVRPPACYSPAATHPEVARFRPRAARFHDRLRALPVGSALAVRCVLCSSLSQPQRSFGLPPAVFSASPEEIPTWHRPVIHRGLLAEHHQPLLDRLRLVDHVQVTGLAHRAGGLRRVQVSGEQNCPIWNLGQPIRQRTVELLGVTAR